MNHYATVPLKQQFRIKRKRVELEENLSDPLSSDSNTLVSKLRPGPTTRQRKKMVIGEYTTVLPWKLLFTALLTSSASKHPFFHEIKMQADNKIFLLSVLKYPSIINVGNFILVPPF